MGLDPEEIEKLEKIIREYKIFNKKGMKLLMVCLRDYKFLDNKRKRNFEIFGLGYTLT
ncbi:hypothetical protein LCGC14_2579440, partial [marine sediment metagenome]